MAAFTGMPIDSIESYFHQSKCDHTRIELDQFVQPRNRSELTWYYRCCRSEFVHNATKYWNVPGKGWPLLDKWIQKGMCVLDYGAGTGQNCFYLQSLGAWPVYFEISIPQAEFFRFRCKKRNKAIPIIEPYCLSPEGDYKFDPIKTIHGVFNCILLSQVLEHIPEPGELLKHLISKLTNNGLLLEDTPFGSHNFDELKSWTVNQFETFMEQQGMKKIAHGVWQKCQKDL